MNNADYVGKKPCGCVVCWCSEDNPPKDIAREIAKWARRGLSVERMSTAEARKALMTCDVCKVPKSKEPQETMAL